MKPGLNDQQTEAIISSFPKVLVLAGAGTGKTTTLTERIRYLIKDRQVSGSSIMAVTFTNKASREIFERLSKIVPGGELHKMWLGTFHSIALRMLREAGYKIGYGAKITVYDSDDQMDMISRINDQLGTKLKEPTLRKIINTPNDKGVQQKYGMIVREYEYQLKQNNAVDYRLIIDEALKLLSLHDDIRESYSYKFKHILVDEYQDTNNQQYRLLKLLNPDNLYTVGDNDQGIYGWRGANIQVILNFKDDYPGAKTVTLEQNYRSAPIIIERANNLIRHNTHRFDKRLLPVRKIKGECRVRTVDDPYAEALAVKNEIADLMSEGYDPGDIAILGRTNAICEYIAWKLNDKKVPVTLISKKSDLWKGTPGRNILNMLWLLVNPYDACRAERYLLEDLKINHGEYRHIKDLAASNGKGLLHSYQQYFKIDEGVFPFVKVEKITEATEILYKHLRVDEIETRYPSRWADFNYLHQEIQKFALEFADNLETFLEHTTLRSDQDMMDSAMAQDKVKVMTIHGSKGLEFPIVFIIAAEAGYCPLRNNDPEEERRLFYVAMTRAKDRLIITRPEIREGFNGQILACMPSPYITEMTEQ